MNTLKILGIAVNLAVFLSCGSKNSFQTADATMQSIPSYSTYAFLPNTNPVIGDVDYNDPVINKIIIETVMQHMDKAGYQLERDNPDLLILISTATNTKTQTQTAPGIAMYPYNPAMSSVKPFYEPYYYRGYETIDQIAGYDTHTFQYDEGALVINLVDRVSQETIWKGIASQNIYTTTSNATQQDVLNSIFKDFPIRD